LSVNVTLPVGQAAPPKGFGEQAVPELPKTSTRSKYGDPYTAVVALLLSKFPRQSNVTNSVCGLLFSFTNVILTGVESLPPNTLSPA